MPALWIAHVTVTDAEAYGRYGQAIAPLLEKSGGTPVWQGRQSHMVIGPDDKDWHLIVLVRYPSVGHFVDMVSSPEYQAIVHHRSAALDDSRLIAISEL